MCVDLSGWLNCILLKIEEKFNLVIFKNVEVGSSFCFWKRIRIVFYFYVFESYWIKFFFSF